MKKVLFIIPSFGIGGITVSLLSLATSLKKLGIQVCIFVRSQKGGLSYAFSELNVLPENIWLSYDMHHSSKVTTLLQKLIFYFCRILYHLGLNPYVFIGRIGGNSIDTFEYDAIVGFSESLSFFTSCLPAKKRITWIHSDYKRFLSLCPFKSELKSFEKMDYIITVSEYVANQIKMLYPECINKIKYIHNVIDVDKIKEKSQKQITYDINFDTSCYVIISAGRIDPVKQFEQIPQIASKLRLLTNVKFKWYIIGGGPNEEYDKMINIEISKNGAQDYVYRIPSQENLYPYLAKANLYVCTSLSESYPLVINEARALMVPVVSTNFPSAGESMVNGLDGYITTLESMPETIATLIDNPLVIKKCTIDNSLVLESVCDLFA